MKKSQINLENLEKDLNKAFNILSSFENLEEINEEKIKEKISKLKKEYTQLKEKIKIKYKDYMDTKN